MKDRREYQAALALHEITQLRAKASLAWANINYQNSQIKQYEKGVFTESQILDYELTMKEYEEALKRYERKFGKRPPGALYSNPPEPPTPKPVKK